MDPEFWRDRWRLGDIGFHQAEFNQSLVAHWPALGVDASESVFVPLCGKTLDMRWLRERGHRVIGAELSESAVESFFSEAALAPTVRERGAFKVYEAVGFELLCGNVFELSRADVEGVRAVYDRAALVALPPELRRDYAQVLAERLPERVDMLVIAFEYEQALASGPPFAVHESELRALYEPGFRVELLERTPAARVPPRLQESGVSTFTEAVYAVRRGAGAAGGPGRGTPA